jgi:hypothetical protein
LDIPPRGRVTNYARNEGGSVPGLQGRRTHAGQARTGDWKRSNRCGYGRVFEGAGRRLSNESSSPRSLVEEAVDAAEQREQKRTDHAGHLSRSPGGALHAIR